MDYSMARDNQREMSLLDSFKEEEDQPLQRRTLSLGILYVNTKELCARRKRKTGENQPMQSLAWGVIVWMWYISKRRTPLMPHLNIMPQVAILIMPEEMLT